MSVLFTIPLSGLKDGHHTFEFEINKKFFDRFEESEIKEGELVAIIDVEKRYSHLDIGVKITGKVSICCDRCLEMFEYPLTCENRLLIKFGNERDDDDEIITVPHDAHELELRQYLYEFIHLALPIKRTHPENINGKSTCDPDMLQKLKEHLVEEESETDPRWAELRKLINYN